MTQENNNGEIFFGTPVMEVFSFFALLAKVCLNFVT